MYDQDEPPCEISGRCVALATSNKITNCIYCGKELHKKLDGKWYTWDTDLHPYQEPQDEEASD